MIRFLPFVLLATFSVQAQSWVELKNDPSVNFYDVQAAFEQAWQGKAYEKGQGYKQFKRWEWFVEQRCYPSGDRNVIKQAYPKYYQQKSLTKGLEKSAGNWTELGPFDWQSTSYSPGLGRVNVVAEDPTNANTIYVGTPAGGLWKTTNGGGAWAPLTDEFTSLGISGIVIDHTNNNVIYVSTGDGDGSDTYSLGVMKSTDGGMTWNTTGSMHSLSSKKTTSKIIMHPTNNQILFVAANDGLYKTTDGGDNWVSVISGGWIKDVEFRPFDPNTVYACADQLYVSTDGGDNFSVQTNGLPPANTVNRMAIGVSPAQPNWVYILAGDANDGAFLGLYRSTDVANSFSLRTNTPNIFTYEEDGSGQGGQSWYDMALAVNPNDADRLAVGGINVWTSTDGGANFTISSHWVYPSSIGYTHADIHTLEYYNNRLYCGSDGGIFLSNDYGTSYNDLSSGMQISQFYRLGCSAQNADLIAGGAQDNGSFYYNGTDWTHVLGADGMEAAFNTTNSDIIFVTWQNGPITRSTDGGINWDYGVVEPTANESGAWIVPYLTMDNNQLIVCYENVWLSADNGDNFTQISNFTSGGTLKDVAVCKTNYDYIAVCNFDELYLTKDGGTTWNGISTGLPGHSITDIQFHPTDPEIIYVSLSGYVNGERVYATRDGGQNWINLSGNLPDLPVNTLVLQEGTEGGVYVGTDVGVYYTDSTLSNWQSFMNGLPNVIVNELEIHYGSNTIRAATYGRGMWVSDLFTASTLPPMAEFSFTDDLICAGDSIRFTDASVNAAPGWTWYFPGGSPATSTLQSPSVSYPGQGSYTASLVIQNANGQDSIGKSVSVYVGDLTINLEVNTDDYPDETTWTITDDQGNAVISGGGYTVAGSFYAQDICLNPGCYTFSIYDGYGDGICCTYGQGSYELFDQDGVSIVTGGNYGFGEDTDFCLLIDDSGVDEIKWSFDLYPNPAKDMVTLRLSESRQGEVSFYDATGRVLLQQLLEGPSTQIQVDQLPAGYYFVVVTSEGQRVVESMSVE